MKKPTYEELAAQVDALQKEKLNLLEYAADAERWFNLHDPNGYVSPKRESAKACIAEIRAEAGRAGFVLGHSLHADIMKATYNGEWDAITRFANQYTEQIRQGGAA